MCMKELKVGEKVAITLEVVEADGYSCEGCLFDDGVNACEEWTHHYSCSAKYRSDHKNVIFKEVKE